MTRDEATKLLERGRSAWNAWASLLLKEKVALLESGKWNLKETTLAPKGLNPETIEWLSKAKVVLSQRFVNRSDFTEYVFPGEVDFSNSRFEAPAVFSQARFHGPVNFKNSVFNKDAQFDNSEFSLVANFDGSEFQSISMHYATFSGYAWFQSCHFQAPMYFGYTHFLSRAFFNASTFHNRANFADCRFHGVATYTAAEFKDYADFECSSFLKSAYFAKVQFYNRVRFRPSCLQDATFERATFGGPADFRQVTFTGPTSFRTATIQNEFDLGNASFDSVPDFTQCTFRREPRLDNIAVRSTLLGPYFREPTDDELTSGPPSRLPFRIDTDAPAKFRELKRMAINAHDGIREMEFHAQEIRSSRFVTDWPLHWRPSMWPGVLRFWLGIGYGAVSDYGRSLMRPLALWLFLAIGCALAYLSQSPSVAARADRLGGGGLYSTFLGSYKAWLSDEPCVPGLSASIRRTTSAVREAVHLSFANAFVIGPAGSADELRRTYGCLYGIEPGRPDAPSIIPIGAANLSLMQRVLSVALLFLFGLALRNTLKLK